LAEPDPLKGKFSWVAPVARERTKCREGDVVPLQTPLGMDALGMISVEYPEPVAD